MQRAAITLALILVLGSTSVIAMNTQTETNSGLFGNEKGWFLEGNYGVGRYTTRNSSFNDSSNLPLSAQYANKDEKTSETGLGFGFQYSAIKNRFLQALQIKRASLALEYFHTNGVNESGILNRNNYTLYNYQTNLNSANRMMIDGKVNIFSIWHVSPYLSAGIGAGQYTGSYHYTSTFTENTITNPSVSSTKLVYQFGVGMDFLITQHIEIGLGYEHLNAGEMTLSNASSSAFTSAPTINLSSNLMLLDVKYNF